MKMKFPALLFAVAFLSMSAIAQNASPVPSISQLLPPPLPAGVNSAVYPAPRQDWVQRVQSDNERARKQTGIRLIFDGDSITDRWLVAGTQIWQERYEKIGAFDFGISGDRTQHLLWRLAQGQVDGIQPRLVALMIGTNNLGGNSVDEIAAGVTAIVRDYQTRCPGAVILLQGIFPRGKDANDPLRAKIKAVNAIIARLNAKQIPTTQA